MARSIAAAPRAGRGFIGAAAGTTAAAVGATAIGLRPKAFAESDR